MSRKVVRISAETRERLNQLAKLSGEPVAVAADAAVDLLYRQQFLNECNRAYARLTSSRAEWEVARQERVLWDATLSDALDWR